jgi:hypothetical protein
MIYIPGIKVWHYIIFQQTSYFNQTDVYNHKVVITLLRTGNLYITVSMLSQHKLTLLR